MSKCTILFFVTLLVASASFSVASSAQGVTRSQAPIEPDQRINSIFFELAGSGGLWSINYERLFDENFGGRVGIGVQSSFETNKYPGWIVFIPATINYLMTTTDHGIVQPSKLEVGVGAVLLGSMISSPTKVVGTATIAYRYQPSDGGYLFRIAFTPFLEAGRFEPWGGISCGLTF